MVTLLARSKEDEMTPLDEKQIQERLYGKYHKEAVKPSAGIPPLKKNDGKQDSNIASDAPKIGEKSSGGEGMGLPSMGSFMAFLSHVPWKFIGALAGAFVTTLLLVHLISSFVSRVKPEPSDIPAPKTQKPVVVTPMPGSGRISASTPSRQIAVKEQLTTPAPVVPRPVKTETTASQQITAPVASPAPVPPAASEDATRGRFYGVQVCTYQRKADAETLVNDLNQKGFNSFFREVPGQQRSFFVVFLNRSKTYAEAQSVLAKFKAHEASSEFRDAFIRSI